LGFKRPEHKTGEETATAKGKEQNGLEGEADPNALGLRRPQHTESERVDSDEMRSRDDDVTPPQSTVGKKTPEATPGWPHQAQHDDNDSDQGDGDRDDAEGGAGARDAVSLSVRPLKFEMKGDDLVLAPEPPSPRASASEGDDAAAAAAAEAAAAQAASDAAFERGTSTPEPESEDVLYTDVLQVATEATAIAAAAAASQAAAQEPEPEDVLYTDVYGNLEGQQQPSSNNNVSLDTSALDTSVFANGALSSGAAVYAINTVLIAVANFTPQVDESGHHHHQLAVAAGDVVQVVKPFTGHGWVMDEDDNEGWTYVVLLGGSGVVGSEGEVPTSYVRVATDAEREAGLEQWLSWLPPTKDVEVDRSRGKLGLAIKEARAAEGGKAVAISKVSEGGVAHQSGEFEEGMRIYKINGRAIPPNLAGERGLTKKAAVNMISTSPAKVVFTVDVRPTALPTAPAGNEDKTADANGNGTAANGPPPPPALSPNKNTSRAVELREEVFLRKGPKGFGITFDGGRDRPRASDGSTVHYITKLVPGGVADQDKRLRAGGCCLLKSCLGLLLSLSPRTQHIATCVHALTEHNPCVRGLFSFAHARTRLTAYALFHSHCLRRPQQPNISR
jgi:hypothetical protein